MSSKESSSLSKWHRRDELVGKEIVDSEAKRTGVVRDLAWSPDGKMALIVEKEGADEAVLPFAQVEKIGDVVFIKSASALEALPTKSCPVCKLKNPAEAKFCARCGKQL